MRRVRISLGPIHIAVRASISVARTPKPSSPRRLAAGRRLIELGGARFSRRRVLVGAVLAVLAVLGGVLVGVVVLSSSGAGPVYVVSSPNMGRGAAFSPVVRYSGRPPTGYVVTFRYRDPRAKLVQIEGEWSFTNPAESIAGNVSQGLPPSQWRPGDIALNPWAPGLIMAGLKSTWPTANMTKDSAGVWSYTIPLPSGVYSYGFVVNCTRPDLTADEIANPNIPGGYTGCPEIADPSNPPWNERGGVTHGSVVIYSQVYVPSDRAFHTVDYWWEAPTSPRGALTEVTYHGTAGPPDLPGRNYLAIYTPPGYDPHRPAAYPTLYLSHGYDTNEIDWSTGGDAANILDELIDKREIKPLVVVMTNAYWEAPPAPTPGRATVYDKDLLNTIIPYIQAHYDVSREPSERAFAGLSYGGYVAGTLLVDHTNQFGSYGLFSPAAFPLSLEPAQITAIKHVAVMIGSGSGANDDPTGAADAATLQADGDHVATYYVYGGGHDWFTWRQLLHRFLTRVAFKPASR